uniref:HDC19718 n=1 Tax=Drosophila melanogaster TaxID=7227 RepID=Q6II47_DROME|nr:TPA_inf: HDC19718 [Drosophila melanogaster]
MVNWLQKESTICGMIRLYAYRVFKSLPACRNELLRLVPFLHDHVGSQNHVTHLLSPRTQSDNREAELPLPLPPTSRPLPQMGLEIGATTRLGAWKKAPLCTVWVRSSTCFDVHWLCMSSTSLCIYSKDTPPLDTRHSPLATRINCQILLSTVAPPTVPLKELFCTQSACRRRFLEMSSRSMKRSMDDWMNGWTLGWMDGWMDGHLWALTLTWYEAEWIDIEAVSKHLSSTHPGLPVPN